MNIFRCVLNKTISNVLFRVLKQGYREHIFGGVGGEDGEVESVGANLRDVLNYTFVSVDKKTSQNYRKKDISKLCKSSTFSIGG